MNQNKRRNWLIAGAVGLAVLIGASMVPGFSGEREAMVPAKAESICPVLTGTELPAIGLKDMNGKTVDLNARIAESPAVLVYYRGGW